MSHDASQATAQALRRGSSGRLIQQRIAFVVLALSALLVALPVLYIAVWLVLQGGPGLSWQFLTEMPRRRGMEGGILPAILGTLYLMFGTIAFALPVGVLAAVYLSEYARPSRLTRLINLSIVNLAGVPSIVYGMFGLGLFVLTLGFGSSLLSASLTLACQALAMVITTSRESLLAVPRTYREACLAMGVTKWQTTRHVVLPQAMPGILTGAVLAVGRAAGETAPILAVGAAFVLPRLPQSPFDQFMALPYHLYVVATQVPQMPSTVKWSVALVLVGVVLAFNSAAVLLRLKLRERRYS